MSELAKSFVLSRNAQKHSSAHGTYSAPRTTRPRIGQILLESGVIQSGQLHHALKLAVESKQSVGRMLIGLGYVGEKNLESALLAQSLISEGVLTEQLAFAAVREAAQKRISLTEALKQFDDAPNKKLDDGGLGDMLVSSGMISRTTFDVLRNESEQTGVSLGRMMLLTNNLTVPMLDSALSVMTLLRDDVVSRTEAIRVLREVQRGRTNVREALTTLKIGGTQIGHAPKLGELLCRTKVVTDQELVLALERALMKGKLLGEELIAIGAVSSETIANAITIQAFINAGVISEQQGREVLACAITQRCEVTGLAAAMGMFADSPQDGRALQLCIDAAIISDLAVCNARKQTAFSYMDPAKTALAMGTISYKTLTAAAQLAEMVEAHQLPKEFAIAAILYCVNNDVETQISLTKLGLVPDQKGHEKTRCKPLYHRAMDIVRDWFTSAEVGHLVCYSLAVVGIAFLVMRYAHVEHSILFSALLFALPGIWLKYSGAWRQKCSNLKIEEELRLVNARCTKERLARKTLS